MNEFPTWATEKSCHHLKDSRFIYGTQTSGVIHLVTVHSSESPDSLPIKKFQKLMLQVQHTFLSQMLSLRLHLTGSARDQLLLGKSLLLCAYITVCCMSVTHGLRPRLQTRLLICRDKPPLSKQKVLGQSYHFNCQISRILETISILFT